MASGVPSYVAFLVGAAIGVIGFGPVHRWIVSLPGTWVGLSAGVIFAASVMLLTLRRQAAGSSSPSHT